MTKVYTLTIAVGDAGTDEEKEQLLANMLKRIGEENSSMGQAHILVTSIVEVLD